MPDENKVDEVGGVGEKKDEKEGELTLESLKGIVTTMKSEYDGAIEALKTENTNKINQVMQTVQEKYDLTKSDMDNITNLLGGLAKQDDDGVVVDDDLTSDKVKTIANKAVDERKQSDDKATKEESKVYFKEYSEEVGDLMDEEGPDGKSLSQEARDGIKKLLIETVIDKSNNPTKDAHRNFKKATKIFFGLGKTHGFKGEGVDGTGGGGSDNKKDTKKVYKLTDESKKMLADIGETEEWGQKKLAEREAAAAV